MVRRRRRRRRRVRPVSKPPVPPMGVRVRVERVRLSREGVPRLVPRPLPVRELAPVRVVVPAPGVQPTVVVAFRRLQLRLGRPPPRRPRRVVVPVVRRGAVRRRVGLRRRRIRLELPQDRLVGHHLVRRPGRVRRSRRRLGGARPPGGGPRPRRRRPSPAVVARPVVLRRRRLEGPPRRRRRVEEPQRLRERRRPAVRPPLAAVLRPGRRPAQTPLAPPPGRLALGRRPRVEVVVARRIVHHRPLVARIPAEPRLGVDVPIPVRLARQRRRHVVERTPVRRRRPHRLLRRLPLVGRSAQTGTQICGRQGVTRVETNERNETNDAGNDDDDASGV
mmetsp:Transcript_37694/g.120942  ORF Transcript_37694/g.120942 Transcript_37694/m.120942 type:complete len:334 (-) Transcript_37694:620-1621(-)